MKKIELLAPARDLQCGVAAVECGADAVYMGAPRFGARRSAGNTAEDIARMVEYARPLGVKVYATLNTLVYDSELRAAEAVAQEVVAAGVDALIVQDMAFMRMGLEGMEMHASTQAANLTPEHVRFLGQAGFSRVILERGLTLGQIREIRQATDVELECFVHGAICVGYSGICYLSRSMSPRSGNRGDCSQPCRLTYDLEDAGGRTLVGGKHLLSVKDLDLSGRVGDLLDAGITSFKIEGRLKNESYVRNITLYYNRLLDAELARREGLRRSSPARVVGGFEPDPGKSFTRGSTVWMLDGKRAGSGSHDTPKASGSYVGRVVAVAGGGFRLDVRHDLVPGDGICFFADSELRGTNINRVADGVVWPDKASGIEPGTAIFRNYDRMFEKRIGSARCNRAIDTRARVEFRPDELFLSLTDAEGITATAGSDRVYEPAGNPEKARASIREQAAKSGGTIFRITEVEIADNGLPVPFVPVSELNALRRKALDALRQARIAAAEKSRHTPELGNPADTQGVRGFNITNRMAEEFYRGAGVADLTPGLDQEGPPASSVVMTSPYCLRRELGWCLKEDKKGAPEGPLYLRRGSMRYRLEFDCAACLMKLINEP